MVHRHSSTDSNLLTAQPQSSPSYCLLAPQCQCAPAPSDWVADPLHSAGNLCLLIEHPRPLALPSAVASQVVCLSSPADTWIGYALHLATSSRSSRRFRRRCHTPTIVGRKAASQVRAARTVQRDLCMSVRSHELVCCRGIPKPVQKRILLTILSRFAQNSVGIKRVAALAEQPLSAGEPY